MVRASVFVWLLQEADTFLSYYEALFYKYQVDIVSGHCWRWGFGRVQGQLGTPARLSPGCGWLAALARTTGAVLLPASPSHLQHRPSA